MASQTPTDDGSGTRRSSTSPLAKHSGSSRPGAGLRAVQYRIREHGIATNSIEPGSPWQRGHDESFDSVLRGDRLNRCSLVSVRAARLVRERCHQEYNQAFPWGTRAAHARHRRTKRALGGQEQRPRRSGQDFGRLRDWTRLVGLVGYALGAGSSQGVAVANRRSRSLVEERSGGLDARKGVLSSPGRTSEFIRHSPVETCAAGSRACGKSTRSSARRAKSVRECKARHSDGSHGGSQ